MNATVAPVSPPVEATLFRLYLLRAAYVLNAVGLGIDVWPRVLGAGAQLGGMDGVAHSFWATLALLAAVGIRYPLKMLPLLLVQLVYKVIWLLAVAWPASAAGATDTAISGMLWSFVVGAVVDLVVIPWPYVYRNYVLAPGARWRGAGARAGR